MNAKQKKLYDAIFKDPVQADIAWREIENLLRALGAKISEGHGSRVRIELNGERAVFHRPHPQKITDKGAIKSMRKFLNNAGVKYDEL
ncbi:type II toxin-antitoxin system HicA family toxin [Treponema sp. Marseille-Q4130]|uniref:type II toxin-antitoxin system HicA family toxin n=1 Tax=Treponema sp. Marseille-Q4130 TaxID=2766702 RepID=UPI0016523DD7|nr:type II toxin-antitoxin system HicA family toxin [Treponema sp. Marseille-Q4130]